MTPRWAPSRSAMLTSGDVIALRMGESPPGPLVGAMGTRAKQCAAQEQLALEFTYGVIDKCILRALRGQDSLILTTGSMVSRVAVRVEAYCRESGNTISVISLNTTNHPQ